eukprot:m.148322 g.148322  ORF g.148322 m.148322 type:complete len:516 (-) comp23196_c0_seq2:111-1658(-)
MPSAMLGAYAGPHLMDLPVYKLQQLIGTGVVTPTEVIEASLHRIAERDSDVHSFLYIGSDQARAEARAQTDAIRRGETVGPLAGIPLAVKDLEDVAGMPTTRGLVPMRETGKIATTDSIQVGRLRRAGAIVVGKTNTPADGHIAITKNLLGPPSCNPWALDRSPGGSSGGAAAAVAARMVPWATASDGGGSIRIPATLTGTFGHKPTRGLIPIQTAEGGVQSWLRTTVMGPITRCTRDAAIYLDFTAGYHADDPDSVVITHGAPTGFEASLIRSPSSPIRRLKVGFIEALVPSHLAQPDIARCVTACTARLRRVAVHAFGADAVIDLASPNMPVFGSEWVTAVGAFRLARFERDGLTNPAVSSRIDRSITSDWPTIKRDFSVDSMGEVFAKIAATNRELAALFAKCDVVVAPSLGLEAYGARGPAAYLALGKTAWDPSQNPFEGMMPLNYSGHPAAVVRAGMTDSGLPCAVQLIAERGRDADALLLASLYEDAHGCFDKWPSWPFRAVAVTESKL